MNLETQILTQNPCYRTGRKIKPKGIMLHSPGVAQPNPDVFVNAWNNADTKVCVHAFVGADRVIQTLPWDHRAWHCGGDGNNTYISFEICEPAGHTYQGGTMIGYDAPKHASFFAKVYQNAVELAAYLCKLYGFNPYTQIVCHSEGHARGIASNHADVMHWFPKHGKDMDVFRADVDAALKGESDMTREEVKEIVRETMLEVLAEQRGKPVSEWAESSWEKAKKTGVFDGTEPKDALTREEAATVLDRCGVLPARK